MGSKQIRIGQLIAPFGPGSIYTDRRGTPLVVCGLDHWFMRNDPTQGWLSCDSRSEFERFEGRLSALLGVDRFCIPPDYRGYSAGKTPPPNAGLNVPAVRFPRWYRHSKTGKLRRFNLNSRRIDPPEDGGRWLPVRFVSICAAGHLCEFPWKAWISCQCSGDGDMVLTDRGGSELNSIRVQCQTCPPGSKGNRGRDLSGTTTKPGPGEDSALQDAGIQCPGDRPWLGETASQPNCSQPLIGALINQTNLYFPRTLSAISLPDLELRDDEVTTLRNEIEKDAGNCGIAKTLWNMKNQEGALALIESGLRKSGISYKPEKVSEALKSLFSSTGSLASLAVEPTYPDSELLAFRRAEFNIIRKEVNDVARIPNLVVIPAAVPAEISPWLAKLNLVERLRETRVFFGFDRLEPNNTPLVGMPAAAIQQLFRFPPSQRSDCWLPAIEVFGEGIYLELNEAFLTDWQTKQNAWLNKRLTDDFVARLGAEPNTLPPQQAASRTWASRYLLVHSLAHILINQLVFECGYSTASLRERLYVSADSAAPMAGILIYTAAGDSEGTLGGLVRLGQPDRIVAILQRAISRAAWCSADPVCSEHLGGQGTHQNNLAACHGCVLLPETSCETINHGLDRAMIVGTPQDPSHGFLAELSELAYYLE